MILDCDGVLVDSEPIANEVLAACLAEIGWPISFAETVRTFTGRSGRDGLAIIERRLGRAPPPDFGARYEARCRERFERELRPVPGVEAALDALGTPTCVASSSSPDRLRLTLGLTGLWPRFEGRVFSAAEVERGKPWPDLFLHAARRMGTAPERCVVVEDSRPGVEAAVAAGMPVLGYAGLTPAAELAAAGARPFRDMAELPALVEATP